MHNRPSVLVTGAAGFIGSHVADRCLKLGFNVVATDDLSGGCLQNVPKQAHWMRGDLRDSRFVESLFVGPQYAYIYHLAAYAAEGLSHFIRRFNYQTNLVASANLINEAVKNQVRCFIFTSSIAVYGSNQTPLTEEMEPRPEDPYGISKYAVELDLRAAHEMFGLDFIVFRPHNVYGERQNIADPYRNVIGIFMNQLLRHEPMTIFGDGLQTRAFTHIDDIASIIAQAPLVPDAVNQVFNIGADTPCTILQLAGEVAAAFGCERNVKHLPARNEAVHAFSNHAKTRRVFNPPAALDLKTGIGRMADWVKSRGAAPPVSFSEIEVTKNLPPSWL